MRKNLIINQTFSRGVGVVYEANYQRKDLVVVKNPTRQDYPYSLKVNFGRNNDNRLRSEIGTDPNLMSNEPWLGISILIPEDYIKDNVDYSIFQFQAAPDIGETWGNPPLSFIISGNKLKVDVRTDATKINPSKQMNVHDSFIIGDITPGKWMDIVLHIKWGYNNDGILQLWLNNNQILDRKDYSIGYNDDKNHYFKFGIYSWNIANSIKPINTIYYAAVRVGNELATYNDVYPGKVLVSSTTIKKYYDGSREVIENKI